MVFSIDRAFFIGHPRYSCAFLGLFPRGISIFFPIVLSHAAQVATPMQVSETVPSPAGALIILCRSDYETCNADESGYDGEEEPVRTVVGDGCHDHGKDKGYCPGRGRQNVCPERCVSQLFNDRGREVRDTWGQNRYGQGDIYHNKGQSVQSTSDRPSRSSSP